MRRRDLISLAGGAIFAWAPLARAEPKMPRLGYAWVGPAGSDGQTLSGLLRGLAEHGYVEGRSVIIERRYADGKPERLPHLVTELLAIPIDIMLSPGTTLTSIVQRATRTVPVIAATGDLLASGFVASLSRPGGNITGLSLGSAERFAGKWLEILKETLPRLVRAAVLYDPANPAAITQNSTLKTVATQLNVELAVFGASGSGELDLALSNIAQAQANGLIVTDGKLFAAERLRIIRFAAKQRISAIYGLDEFAPAGGLMSYSASIFDIWRKAAGYVDRILKGASPADLPVEQPTKFQLVINLKTAKTLGLTIPESILVQADKVIE